eukprot:Nk52_evm35s914 gene=Nk52_evmTU35s914
MKCGKSQGLTWWVVWIITLQYIHIAVFLYIGCVGVEGKRELAEVGHCEGVSLADLSLIHSSVIVRHGIITPKKFIPKSSIKWPNAEILTGLGVLENFKVGEWLREEYITSKNPFVSETWNPKHVYFRASAEVRSGQAASSLAFGMYPPGSGPSMYGAKGNQVPFHPVSVNSVPRESESLLRPWTKHSGCRKYRKYLVSLVQSNLYKTKVAENEAFLSRMQNATGFREGMTLELVLFDINRLQEALATESLHGFSFLGKNPSPISNEDFLLLTELSAWNYVQQFREHRRLHGGNMVKELVSNFKKATMGTAPKIAIYSAHQRTFFGLESCLDIVKERIPPNGYHFVFELFRSQCNTFYIRLRARDISGDEQEIILPFCANVTSRMCTLSSFVDGAQEMMPVDWLAECQVA